MSQRSIYVVQLQPGDIFSFEFEGKIYCLESRKTAGFNACEITYISQKTGRRYTAKLMIAKQVWRNQVR